MATSVQASLRDVGIDLKVDPLERAAAREAYQQNRYDISFMWFSYGDPDVLRTIFHSANVDAFNRAKYQVPEVDKMLEEAAGSTDPAKRSDHLQGVQQRVLKDTAVVPLVDTLVYNAKRAEVSGRSPGRVWRRMSGMYDVQIKKVIPYITQRLVQAIPVLVGISILSFLMLHLVPGDPVQIFAGDKPLTAERAAELRHAVRPGSAAAGAVRGLRDACHPRRPGRGAAEPAASAGLHPGGAAVDGAADGSRAGDCGHAGHLDGHHGRGQPRQLVRHGHHVRCHAGHLHAGLLFQLAVDSAVLVHAHLATSHGPGRRRTADHACPGARPGVGGGAGPTGPLEHARSPAPGVRRHRAGKRPGAAARRDASRARRMRSSQR